MVAATLGFSRSAESIPREVSIESEEARMRRLMRLIVVLAVIAMFAQAAFAAVQNMH